MIALFWLATTAASAAPPLTLEDAVAEALAKTSGVIQAKADLLLADVDKMKALAPILPKVDLTIAATENFRGSPIAEQRGGPRTLDDLVNFQRTGVITPGPFTDTNFSSSSEPQFSMQLTGNQLIYDGGRWWLVIGQANDLEREKRAALAVVENDTRLNVARRFWELAKSLRGAEAVAQQVEIDEAQLARAKAMLEAGVNKVSDVAQAERNLAIDRIGLAQREQGVRAGKRLLNLAMGRESAIDFQLAIPDEPVPTEALPPKDELIDSALELRPDLVRNRASLDALEKNVGVARADYFPAIGLRATYGKQSRRPDRVFGDPTENYFATLGLGLTWNLYNGGATNANVETAELDLAKLVATYDDNKRVAAADVEERLDLLALALRVYQLSMDSMHSGEEAVRLARGLYAEGRGTLLEVRDAEVGLTQLTLTLIEARFNLEIAREELRRAVGGELAWPKQPG